MYATLRTAPALLALAALAACGQSETVCKNRVEFAAPVVIAPDPRLIAPVSGSTGLPTTGVNVELTSVLPATGLHVTALDTGVTLPGSPFTPAPDAGSSAAIPSGAVVSALPALAPHTTYTIFLELPPRTAPIVACNGIVIPSAAAPADILSIGIGAFTTQ
jgi:hypothetical protein